MFKVNNKTTERHVKCRFDDFIVNFERISHLSLVIPPNLLLVPQIYHINDPQ